MFLISKIRLTLPGAAMLLMASTASLHAQSLDTPMKRMRPIGSPSAVDQYKIRSQPATTTLHETSYQSPVRQTVMLQQGSLTSPPLLANPSAPMTLPANPSALPVPGTPRATVAPLASDMQPVPQPELGTAGFTTIDNSCLVSPPSSYSAAFVHDCSNTVVPQSYLVQPAAAPVTYAPAEAAIAVPAVAVPATVKPNAHLGAPARSLFTFGQERYPVQVGQGIVGQPVAYVPGQPIRNWLRYFTP